MKLRSFLIFVLIMIVGLPFNTIYAGGGSVKPDVLEQFYQELIQEIDAAEHKVKILLEQIEKREELLTSIKKLELQTAIQMLEVKKTLFANFKDTSSLNSPLVRD